MRFIIGSPVDDRGKSRRHLHHGAVEILSKAIGGKAGGIHVVNPVYEGSRVSLTWKINACLGTEIEHVLVFLEYGLSLHGSHMHHGVIAGYDQGLFQCHISVTAF